MAAKKKTAKRSAKRGASVAAHDVPGATKGKRRKVAKKGKRSSKTFGAKAAIRLAFKIGRALGQIEGAA